MYDIIILGGGPAGLTAATYAIHKRLDALMITRDLGGKTNFHLQLPFVERHMLINGDELVSRFSREIEYLAGFRWMDNAASVEKIAEGYRVTTSAGQVAETRTLVVATGAKPELLDVPGEREFMMRGLCYSAVSYAQLFIDRTTAVIGSDALALRSVAELARVSSQVTLICERQNGHDSLLRRQIQAMKNVRMLMGYRIKEIRGDMYARTALIDGPDGEMEIVADAFFVEQALIPRSAIVADLVELDANRHIKINARNETSAAGIFAAGDVTDGYAEQVLIAIGEGAKAALSANEYLLTLEREEAVPV